MYSTKGSRLGPLEKYVEDENGCWLWTGASNVKGYGKHGQKMAHRVVYELLVEPIPAGLQIDHLCRVRSCVNPRHLQPVTPRVNTLRGFGPCGVHARKTHCPSGHAYEGDNLYLSPQGFRRCRSCVAKWQRDYQERKKAEAALP